MPAFRPPADDEARLEHSKMSFGEHLEELRKAIFKSVAALFLGFLLGLWIGNDVIRYIEKPLNASLERFYFRQADAKQKERIAEFTAKGREIPQGYSMS